jgi:arylformamidase
LKTNEFQEQFVHIPQDTAAYLADLKVRTVGVDYLSVGGYEKDSSETHQALLGAGIWLIEGLNLKHVEPGEYELVCLPLKLVGSDGAPARAVLRRL